VGTGQVDGKKGAELYDQDVKKQAQQLGLPGWE
jgi:raffinose/stachyose/melibiose transport system substrate-binding protein